MQSAAGRLDVHHHMVPPFYAQALKKLGVDDAAGAPLPDWTPEKSLALMDATGIAKAFLSISCPGVYFGDAHVVPGTPHPDPYFQGEGPPEIVQARGRRDPGTRRPTDDHLAQAGRLNAGARAGDP